jgi:hypothetical protein
MLGAGYSGHEIRSAVAAGRWTALHPGVYVPTADLASLDRVRRHVAIARGMAGRSPGLVISHASAAAALGLPMWGASLHAVHLTRIGRGGNQRTPARIVHSGLLRAGDVIVRSNMLLTAPARTLVDIGRTTTLDTAVALADAALVSSRTTP